MAKIAFLGLGAMGSRMARHLINADHQLTVWNRDPLKTEALVEFGAKAAKTPKQAAEDQDVVIAMLRDDDASEQVWLDSEHGAYSAMRPESIAIECSTLSVPFVRRLAQVFRSNGIGFLDAPVVGSRPQAESKQLFFLVGGDEPIVSRCLPLLEMMGHSISHIGDNGAGATLKLVVNELFAVQVATLAEGFGFLQASGVDTRRAFDALSLLPIASPVAKTAAAAMQSNSFAPLFPLELAEKDMAYALKSASQRGCNLPMAETTQKVMAQAIAQGFGADNLTGVVRLYSTKTSV